MYVDSEAHRQIARERHEEMARGARRIPAEQHDEPRKSASRMAAIIRRTRRRRPRRSPAYRA